MFKRNFIPQKVAVIVHITHSIVMQRKRSLPEEAESVNIKASLPWLKTVETLLP